MHIHVLKAPQKHIVVDAFLSPPEVLLALEEVASLVPRLSAGQVLRADAAVQSTFTKRNRNLWLEDTYPDRSKSMLLRLFKERLWSPPIMDAFRELDDLLFEYATLSNRQATLLSVYSHGDFYKEHEDEFPGIAANLFLGRLPQRFTGGDFHLGHARKVGAPVPRGFTRVPFEPGRLVIFPTRAPHFVDPVKQEGGELLDGRISVQHWPTYVVASG